MRGQVKSKRSKGKSERHPFILFFLFTFYFLLPPSSAAQSSDQNFPSPVTTNEINGKINARDIGDSRLTRYFYAFDGNQGDIFVNLVTTNLEGSIDIFAADGLRLLTKIVVYAGSDATETGRLIYLRKAERMLLRVEGRTPNDDAATFRIKFGGSFVALKDEKLPEEPKVAEKTEANTPGIRVNSVGTIIAVVPKPPPPAKPVLEKKTEPTASKAKTATAKTPPAKPAKVESAKNEPSGKSEKKSEPKKETETPAATVETPKKEEKTAETLPAKPAPKPSKPKSTATAKAKEKKTAEPPKEVPADPMASINLLIEFKDGRTIARPMSEVLRFSVEKAVLVVVSKDGSIGRYSMLDVAKVSIQ